MKRYQKIILSGFILALVFSFMGFTASCERISEKVIRLHVLANSDSEYDQRMKLSVKDQVSAYTGSLLEGTESLREAEAVLTENLQNIENVANKRLGELHAGYSAKAVMEDTFFETREYEDFSLPAGNYKALRVLIGEGAGRNWWCVVYPSLCVSAAAEDFKDFSQTEKDLVQKPVKVSFKVYEWYQELVNFFQK